MKIKDIEKKWSEANENLIQMQEALTNAKNHAKDLQDQAEEAALAGDLETYKKLKAEAADEESFAYVYEKQIEKLHAVPAVTKGEVIDAWSDYSASFNKDLNAKLAKFENAKQKMLKEFAELVDMQNVACATRERLASFIGKKLEPLALDGGLGKMFPMDSIPCKGRGADVSPGKIGIQGSSVTDPNGVYYLSSLERDPLKLYNSVEEQTIKNVLVFRVSQTK